MSLNGSGLYLVNSAGQPVVAATTITSAAFNAFTADIATALSTAIFRDGQQTITANIPMAGFVFTGIGSGISSRTRSASIADVQDGAALWGGTAGGTADALTFSMSPPITAYATGQSFVFKSSASANTTAATVAINGLTTKAIQNNGAALIAGDIEASTWYRITYDGAAFQLEKLWLQARPFIDTNPMVVGSVDVTKKVRFEVDGLTTATTRVVTMPDADVSLGALISNTIVDAKGDLIVATAADAVARKAVGSNGLLLAADSTTADGLAYLAACMSFVKGCDCANNSGTPNTQFDLDADAIVLHNANNGTIVRFNPGAAITNNVSMAGAAANGRDQAGAFSASSWVHFYWIWDGSTLATVSSAVAPPTGPTFPSGYTHWAYAGAVRFNGSSQLLKTRIKGAVAYYEAKQSAAAAVTATTETSVDLSALIPPNAHSSMLNTFGSITRSATGSTNSIDSFKIRYISGSNFAEGYAAADANVDVHITALGGWSGEIPNTSQTIYYIWVNIAGSASTVSGNIDVLGYRLPNGGE